MNLKNKLATVAIILQGFVFNASAAPEDHGRIFNDTSPFSIIVGAIIVIFLVISWIASKFPTKETQENSASSKYRSSTFIREKKVVCPICEGNGYIIKYMCIYTSPGEWVSCERCKGRKHELNEDAKKQINQIISGEKRQDIRTQSESNKNYEKQLKIKEEERETKEKELQNQRKAEIEAEGRTVYSLTMYREKIHDLKQKRKNIFAYFKQLLPTMQKCECVDNSKCDICLGSKYVLNEIQKQKWITYKTLLYEQLALEKDMIAIYGEPKTEVRCNRFETIQIRSQEDIINSINRIVCKLPFCQECQGLGGFTILECEKLSYGKFKHKYVCPKCSGSGWIYSDVQS